ncbi:HTH-type transcriptional activator IlvY [Alloalcanivorax gelatiniphagus]|uniref:HTH-type transcriptional activator IlvY n=1 Tax=Alloalcanivorax gelatiniphagus TaxID=1194167 RepID=A0ABY2XQI7_9GAMM|nr:HTH-type transcriptional activator IlvY [Alloalcanivorax gelatiniphagus]TMW15017.1 HTH-type transcriptional activator IlvY [Alloalcanivorax gelatiniphagus]|tara:strand:+ start:3919 stop:4803 length:885 start_codon:yes stop_codon:yes gene_type:complete
MDTRPLRLFLALAETLHFGRAGDRCHMSPSAVSRTIRQLEDELGVTLFLRDNRSVSLTREGRRFQQYAREALAQWDSLRHSMQESGRVLQGELSLYCSVTASYSFLYDILSRFRVDYPGIEIKLHTGDPAQAMDRVLTGREDIAIGARPDGALPRGLAFRPILRSPLLFIAPSDQPRLAEALSGPARAEAWREVPMILSEQGLSRQRLDQWFRTLGVTPRIYAQVSGNEAIVSMVSLGFGVGVAPRIVLERSPLAERTRALQVTPALADYEVGLFTREKRLADPVIQALWSQPR